MYEQMDIFSFIEPQKEFKPGEYIDKQYLGRQITFDEITQRVGQLIVLDKSTQSHEWYMVALVEKIVIVEGNQRRLVYYDGKKQRGLINEMYFKESFIFPARAFELNNVGGEP